MKLVSKSLFWNIASKYSDLVFSAEIKSSEILSNSFSREDKILFSLEISSAILIDVESTLSTKGYCSKKLSISRLISGNLLSSLRLNS